MEKKKSRNEVEIGRVRATIWANQTMDGTSYSVTVTRLNRPGFSGDPIT